MSIELERWRCPAGHVFDVWLEDGEPEDERATRCPICAPSKVNGRLVFVRGVLDVEATALWSAGVAGT